jgi:hypothetical protein
LVTSASRSIKISNVLIFIASDKIITIFETSFVPDPRVVDNRILLVNDCLRWFNFIFYCSLFHPNITVSCMKCTVDMYTLKVKCSITYSSISCYNLGRIVNPTPSDNRIILPRDCCGVVHQIWPLLMGCTPCSLRWCYQVKTIATFVLRSLEVVFNQSRWHEWHSGSLMIIASSTLHFAFCEFLIWFEIQCDILLGDFACSLGFQYIKI